MVTNIRRIIFCKGITTIILLDYYDSECRGEWGNCEHLREN